MWTPYEYARFKTAELAYDALDAMYAEGLVTAPEKPFIKKVNEGGHWTKKFAWALMLNEYTNL